MIVHVRVHALASLAASAAWPDKKREPNRRQTTKLINGQTGIFYRYRCIISIIDVELFFLFLSKRSVLVV